MSLPRASAALALAALAAFASCSREAGPASWTLVASELAGDSDAAVGQRTEALLRAHSPALIVAHDDATARIAAATCRRLGQPNVLVTGVGGDPAPIADGTLAATFALPTGAAEALALAMLAAHGTGFPPERRAFALGVRQITRANLAENGAPRPAPAEFVLQVMRRQLPPVRSGALAGPPGQDQPRQKIGVVLGPEDSALERARAAELQTAGAEWPQAELAIRHCRDGAAQAAAVQALATDGCRALIVATADAAAVTAACRAALQQKVAVVALGLDLGDACTCTTAPSDVELGNAIAQTAQELLPRGGRIAELRGPDSPRARALHDALVQALQPGDGK